MDLEKEENNQEQKAKKNKKSKGAVSEKKSELTLKDASVKGKAISKTTSIPKKEPSIATIEKAEKQKGKEAKTITQTEGQTDEETLLEIKVEKTPEQIEEENKKRQEREEEELKKLSELDIFRWQTMDYPLATRIVKRDIATLPHGSIRSLCSTYKLTYHTVIGLINETITFEAPKLVLDLLYALEYDVKLTMEITPTGKGIRQYEEEYYYTLRKKGRK